MTPKQTEIIDSYQEKIQNTKLVINSDFFENKNTLQTKKKFFNRSLEIFIESQFGIGNHFVNMTSNFNKVIEHLKLEEIIDFKLRVPTITTKSLSLKPATSNNFDDFETNSIFECTLFSKENVDSEIFLKAIKSIENNFITKYNTIASKEFKIVELEKNVIKKKRQKRELIFLSTASVLASFGTYIYLEFLK